MSDFNKPDEVPYLPNIEPLNKEESIRLESLALSVRTFRASSLVKLTTLMIERAQEFEHYVRTGYAKPKAKPQDELPFTHDEVFVNHAGDYA